MRYVVSLFISLFSIKRITFKATNEQQVKLGFSFRNVKETLGKSRYYWE